MKILRNFVYAIGFVAALALHGDVEKNPRDEKCVDWGKLEYNKGPLRSNGFYGCSAVALDCGDDGFLAHAFFGNYCKDFDDVNIGNIGDKIVERCMEMKIETQKCQVYIHAGSPEALKKLHEDFERLRIPIRFAGQADYPADIRYLGRSVRFDPLYDMFEVTYGSVKEGFDRIPPNLFK